MPYLTAAQIEATTEQLRNIASDLFTRIELPETSTNGRRIHAIRLTAGGGKKRRGFLMIGGMHGRELMNPDAIVELLIDMFVAYRNGQSLSYGSRTWSWFDLVYMIHTVDIWAIPCANPDGRQISMFEKWWWRKNAARVDPNRNFDFAWGTIGRGTSCYLYNDDYCGPNAFSEPESRNIAAFCEATPINTFVDVHSYGKMVLYPWGHAKTQTADAAQRFTNHTWVKCDYLTPTDYREYMLPRDLKRFQIVANRVTDSVYKVRKQPDLTDYRALPIYDLYRGTTSGTSTDYLYSRRIADAKQTKTYAFAMETGPDHGLGNEQDSFQPCNEEALRLIKTDIKAAILTLIEETACGIDYLGETLLDRGEIVEQIRLIRDDSVITTKAGAAWVDLFERVQGPLMGAILSDEKLTSEALRLFESAAELVSDKTATLTKDHISRAQMILRRAMDRLGSTEVRGEIETVVSQLGAFEGLTLARVVGALAKAGPPRAKPTRSPRQAD